MCITSAVKIEPVPESDFDFKEKKMYVSTLEAKQKVHGSAATLNPDGTLEYAIDEHIRLPTCEPLLAPNLIRYLCI